MNCLTGWGY